ncbi:hypothetical protein GBF38_000722 [Nibea albiflora]|nr:hypothetical protein GBF38_000722 [Nibea albiflora]
MTRHGERIRRAESSFDFRGFVCGAVKGVNTDEEQKKKKSSSAVCRLEALGEKKKERREGSFTVWLLKT